MLITELQLNMVLINLMNLWLQFIIHINIVYTLEMSKIRYGRFYLNIYVTYVSTDLF